MINPDFSFTVQHRSQKSNARTGLLHTPHGCIETPAFIFCATKAAFKCIPATDLVDLGTSIILANTYHLMINGGAEVMQKQGGIHKFMGWHGPTLTDSGGFQIFSLGHGSVADEIKRRQTTNRMRSLIKITQDGALFRSHIDGAQFWLTPEKSIQVQYAIGSDLVLVLDECTPFNVDKAYTERSMYTSHAWELRSLAEFRRLHGDHPTQALYGIVQGGIYEDLRKIGADFVVNQQDFFGTAIGGSLGSTKAQMNEVVGYTCGQLDEHRPRHLLGIGIIGDILDLVEHGIDTFDCVHPTRIARHGCALVRYSVSQQQEKQGLNLRNSIFKDDHRPVDPECPCKTCMTVSRSYLHYLLRIGEPLAMILITIHNVCQMNLLMSQIRHAIRDNSLDALRKTWVGR